MDEKSLSAYLKKIGSSSTFYPILHEFLIRWRHFNWSKQMNTTISLQSIKLLKQSCENGYDFFLEQILQNINVDTILIPEKNYTALHLASLYGHVNIIKTLLEYGASLSIPPSPICLASMKGNVDIIKFLIRRGASPDIVCDEKNNATPLWYAASYGFAEIVKIILPYYDNKNPIEISSGRDPLSISCYVGHLNVVKVLIESGISKDGDLNSRPIIIASQEGHADIVKYLLNIGCSPDLRDVNGFTALAIASARQHSDIANLLKKSIKKTVVITSNYNFNISQPTNVVAKLFYDENTAEKIIHYIICCNLALLIIIIFRCVN